MTLAPPYAEPAALLSVLLIMAAGLSLMLQQQAWAGRLLVGAVVLIAAATLEASPSSAAAGAAAPWQWSLALLAIVLAVLCQWGLAAAFAAPLIYSLIVWPTLASLPVAIAILAGTLLVLGVFTRVLSAIAGPEASGHIVGTYLVRLIDAAAGMLLPHRPPRRRSQQ